MKNSIKIILIAFAAAAAGLAVGYFIFSKNDAHTAHAHEQPAAETAGETIYTCSMHPQIRQNEPDICPLCEMDLIPVDDVGGGGSDPAVFKNGGGGAEAGKCADQGGRCWRKPKWKSNFPERKSASR